MSCDYPTREAFIDHIINTKKKAGINITVGVIKRAEIEADLAEKRGEISHIVTDLSLLKRHC